MANMPMMEIGGGIVGHSKGQSGASSAGSAVNKVQDLKEKERIETEDLSPIRTDGRHTQFGSLFKKEPREFLKSIHQGPGRKFTETTYDKRLYTSFSGSDTKMSISFKGGAPIYIGEAQTVTYSMYRPVEPVYVLGDSRPNGFVRGQRTIAGSVIFTVFDRNVLLNAFYNAYSQYSSAECFNQEYLTDELPPFDLHLTFLNEYGISAALVIYGCHIPSEGQVHSVEDMITENTIQYVARDMTLMRPGDIT